MHVCYYSLLGTHTADLGTAPQATKAPHARPTQGHAFGITEQEAQLPQRNSASAAHVYLGWLADMQCTEHRRIAEVVLFFDIQTL